jgi:hypothetical protein
MVSVKSASSGSVSVYRLVPNAFSRNLIRRRHSVESEEKDRQKERKGEGAMKANAFSRRKPATKPRRHFSRKQSIQSKEACYEAAIQSEKKPTLFEQGMSEQIREI